MTSSLQVGEEGERPYLLSNLVLLPRVLSFSNIQRSEAEGKEERKEERKEGWFALHFKILIREELTHACTETALISPLPRERRGVKEDKQAGRPS